MAFLVVKLSHWPVEVFVLGQISVDGKISFQLAEECSLTFPIKDDSSAGQQS